MEHQNSDIRTETGNGSTIVRHNNNSKESSSRQQNKVPELVFPIASRRSTPTNFGRGE